jgi:hypothetical protein
MGSSSRRLLNQSTHSSVANSTASKGSPWSAPMDHLGLVKAVDRLGQGVVIAVADTADRRLDPGLGQALGVLDRDVLAAAVAVVDEAAAMDGPPIMESLLQGIEHEAGMGRPADPPANDIAGVDVDHEGDIDEPRPGRDVSEVRDPQHVRRRCMELAVDLIERARCRLVADRGAHRLAPDHPLQGPDRASAVPPCSGRYRSPSRCICRHTLRTP